MQEPKPKIASSAADPRFQRSIDALIEAMTALADTEPLPTISITRLTETAGVSRPTFYQHTKDVPDLARRAALQRLHSALQVPPDFSDDGAQTFDRVQCVIADRLVAILEHLAQHRSFYLNVLDHAGSPELYAGIVSMLSMHVNIAPFYAHLPTGQTSSAAMTEVIVGGLMWRVVGWLRSDAAKLDTESMGNETATLSAALLCGLSAMGASRP